MTFFEFIGIFCNHKYFELVNIFKIYEQFLKSSNIFCKRTPRPPASPGTHVVLAELAPPRGTLHLQGHPVVAGLLQEAQTRRARGLAKPRQAHQPAQVIVPLHQARRVFFMDKLMPEASLRMRRTQTSRRIHSAHFASRTGRWRTTASVLGGDDPDAIAGRRARAPRRVGRRTRAGWARAWVRGERRSRRETVAGQWPCSFASRRDVPVVLVVEAPGEHHVSVLAAGRPRDAQRRGLRRHRL